MALQDAWRRAPSPTTINMTALSSSESAWLLLLSCEDEFSRAASTQFYQAHPSQKNALHYCSLYRNSRFSDHMLARWVLDNGSLGSHKYLIPTRFIKTTSDMPFAKEVADKSLPSPPLPPSETSFSAISSPLLPSPHGVSSPLDDGNRLCVPTRPASAGSRGGTFRSRFHSQLRACQGAQS